MIKLKNCEPSCTKNYAVELHENWVIAKWNDGIFIQEERNNEFQKPYQGGVS